MWCHVDLVRTDVSEEPVVAIIYPDDGGETVLQNVVLIIPTPFLILEDNILHNYRCENVKSYLLIVIYILRCQRRLYIHSRVIAMNNDMENMCT
jgi:hypothetical protein